MTQGKRTSASILLLSAVLIVGAACGDGDTSGGTDTVVIPGPEATTGPIVLSQAVATMSGDSLWAFATDTSLWSDSVAADRHCADGSGCTSQLNTKKVRVHIWAHKAAKDVHDSAAGPHGTLVAKMENIGDAKERMYGMAPGNVYLLLIYPGTDTSGVYRLVEVSKTPPHVHRVVQTGTQIRCNHPGPWEASWATFVSCADGRPTPPPYVTASRGFDLVKTAYAASFETLSHSKPAWITCPSGCCTSGPEQTYTLTD